MTDMLDDFLVRAALAAVGVALVAASLGCVVVWRRVAYFGDATPHASILGVALALALSLSVFPGAPVVAFFMATAVSVLSDRGFAVDTLPGIMAHASLAFGLVVVSLLSGVRIDPMAYLFGDIPSVSRLDLAVLWCGALPVIGTLGWRWAHLLTATLPRDLAYSAGINPRREQLVLTIAPAIAVAVAIKVVGGILIAALLIVLAMTARTFSQTPARMAIAAGAVRVGSVLAGLALLYAADTPAGPGTVSLAATSFIQAIPARRVSDRAIQRLSQTDNFRSR